MGNELSCICLCEDRKQRNEREQEGHLGFATIDLNGSTTMLSDKSIRARRKQPYPREENLSDIAIQFEKMNSNKDYDDRDDLNQDEIDMLKKGSIIESVYHVEFDTGLYEHGIMNNFEIKA